MGTHRVTDPRTVPDRRYITRVGQPYRPNDKEGMDDRTVLGRDYRDGFAGGMCIGLSIAVIGYILFRLGIALAGGSL